MEGWLQRSQEALDIVTKMVVDIAETLVSAPPINGVPRIVDAMPPTYPYIARAAMRYVHRNVQREDVDWSSSAEEVLQASLGIYFQRWSIDDSSSRS